MTASHDNVDDERELTRLEHLQRGLLRRDMSRDGHRATMQVLAAPPCCRNGR